MLDYDEVAPLIQERVADLPSYIPSEEAWEVLVRGGILSPEEAPQDLLGRVLDTIFSVEPHFGTPLETIERLKQEVAAYMVDGYCMPGTPILTNAGRYNAALSSCAIVPIDLQEPHIGAEEIIRSYYKQNMGSGFDLTCSTKPVSLLHWIDDLAASETATGTYDRYIGNMGLLHISHPAVLEFIRAKRQSNMAYFNISVNVTEEFMYRAKSGEAFSLSNGSTVNAYDLLQHMAENAWYNGDPGLVFLDRMNRDNPVFKIGPYLSTPPCAEMGLEEGETCHFGCLNLRRFVRGDGASATIDYDQLRRVTRLLTRVLDNAIEYSIPRYPTRVSADIAKMKRRIGIGVCGLADVLLAYDLPYDSQEARSLARDIISFINYTSKCSSVELAEPRGSCTAMNFPSLNEYLGSNFLEEKYARRATRTVSADEWVQLATAIRERGLRNISTTALPPTGRTSLLLGTTSSVEPFFNVTDSKGNVHQSIQNFLEKRLQGDKPLVEDVCWEAVQTGSFQHIESLPDSVRDRLKIAKEIAPDAQVSMVAEVAGLFGVVDESASKTVNLPHEATVDDVRKVFLLAYDLGLKNISVYRDKTKAGQPL
jgi:ribonucleoside-diphosphate reductase alpha chain